MNLQNETYEDINNNNKENSNVTTDTVNTDDTNVSENIATETDKTKSECEQNKEHTKPKKDFINGPFKIILFLICVAISIFTGQEDGFSIISASRFTASSPMYCFGTCIVVRDGVMYVQSGISSKPIMEIS